jgi:hypothetical protein
MGQVEAEKKAAEDEKKAVGKLKVKTAKSLVAASSAGLSRSSSVNPEPMLMLHTTCEPTKMRMIVAPLAMGEGVCGDVTIGGLGNGHFIGILLAYLHTVFAGRIESHFYPSGCVL